MSGKEYILGTRGSALAMWQAQFVQWLLQDSCPEDQFKIQTIKTTGDDTSISISEEGGKGLYVKELEQALLDRKVDFCVHSLKDYPIKSMEGCVLAAVAERGDVRDVLISKDKRPLQKFKSGMKIGTSSPRRASLLKVHGIAADVVPIRGNVDTRIEKVKKGEYDGVILAAAGVLRLGLENDVAEYLDPKSFIPAPGQGAIGIECRAEDEELRMKLRRIHHSDTGQAVAAERAFLAKLGGHCMLPLGAWCEIEQFQMRLHSFLSDPSGNLVMLDRSIAPVGYPEQLGEKLAERYLAYGGERIVRQFET